MAVVQAEQHTSDCAVIQNRNSRGVSLRPGVEYVYKIERCVIPYI